MWTLVTFEGELCRRRRAERDAETRFSLRLPKGND